MFVKGGHSSHLKATPILPVPVQGCLMRLSLLCQRDDEAKVR